MNQNSTDCASCNYCDCCSYCNYCNYCTYCDYCDSCDSCNSCNYCNYCTYCDYCASCNSCNYCNYCTYCDYCASCNYSRGLRMSERMVFCLGEGKYESQGIGFQKNYHAFNKKVSKGRYSEILKECKEILKDLKLELKNDSWEDEWKKVSQEQWLKLSKIPEFDKEVVEGIIGFGLELNSQKSELLKKADELIKKAEELKLEANKLN